MKILGIDPGARNTGLAVYDTGRDLPTGALVESLTLTRPPDVLAIEQVPRSYLHEVAGTALRLVREHKVDLIGVEGIRSPSWRVRGREKPLNPAAIIGTAQVLGAITGRAWSIPLVIVPPTGNGRALPLDRYPEPLATSGRGQDKRRHERSAYDVAMIARYHAARSTDGWA